MKKLTLVTSFIVCLVFFGCKQSNIEANAQTTSKNQTTNTTKTNEVSQNSMTSNNGKVVVLTAESFKNLIYDYSTSKNWNYKGNLPAIIDFYADWCRPCKMIAPIMEELAVEYNGKVNFYKLNVDEQSEVAQIFGVSSIPAVLFIPVKGQPQMSVGAMPKESYVKAITEVLLK